MIGWNEISVGFCLAIVVGCSSGGDHQSAASNLPSNPTTPQVSSPDFSDVDAAAAASAIADLAIVVGDETGVLHRYEKGAVRTSDTFPVASASKMVTGLAIWLLIEDGDLARDDQPQDYISFWRTMEAGGRSDISLDQLLGFVSGFNNPPQDPGCIGDGGVMLFDCVKDIHDGGFDTVPGDEFYYGPEHLQIAALMASEAMGRDFRDIVKTRLFDPLGVSASTGWPILSGDNPRFAGALRTSADDYGLLLTAILAGDLVADRAGYLSDRTATAVLAFRPAAIEDNGRDWHYGAGFWIECNAPAFEPACLTDPTISSPGARGFTPWIDFEAGYWAIVAVNEDQTLGFRPAVESVLLKQELQPLIETVLN